MAIHSLESTLSPYFEQFNDFRELLQHSLEGWDTPVVVVFGEENTGKSTILERLAMRPIFPKAEGFCTRVPIRVRLRTQDENSVAILSVFELNKKNEEVIIESATLEHDNALSSIRNKMEELVRRENQAVTGIRDDAFISSTNSKK